MTGQTPSPPKARRYDNSILQARIAERERDLEPFYRNLFEELADALQVFEAELRELQEENERIVKYTVYVERIVQEAAEKLKALGA